MSSRTLFWAVTATIIAAVYFCTPRITHLPGDANKTFSDVARQLNAE